MPDCKENLTKFERVNKMKHDKAFYQNLPKINGFKWAYFDNGLHSFIKKTDQGYLECKMTEQDIQDPDQFEFMLSRGLSRK